ncbi:hypothetical protein MKX08_007969 [Trichoderma sp. CBMAI-0020]|nr:hypothetical protein MKX08_007969 [Trichoderma sp. CBMAI-0020]
MYLKAIKALRSNLKDHLERFNRIYNACGKKGYKKADYCFRKTCEFCGKKGHNETHYYIKKNIKKPKTLKDKA